MSVQPLKSSTHLIFWVVTTIVFVLSVLLFKAVLLPFVMGIAVAYLLNPIVCKFGDIGIARGPASLMILFSFLILILAFVGGVSPILYHELSQFSKDLPEYIEKFWELMRPVTALLEDYIGGAEPGRLESILKDNAGSATKAAQIIIGQIAAGGQAMVDMISVAVFMPIVAYFMMKEWPHVTRWVHDLMPRHSKDVITDILKQIDLKLSGFIRGQISVALVLGIAYAVMLTLVGLKYGFLIGLMSGVLSVIPMVGSAVGLIVSVAVAWFQYGDITFVLLVAGIFLGGQVIEGNFLTPKLVGDSVGLHPLWVFFALLAGGSLLGILGMFLAVPMAAVIGVLLSFALQKYKQSAYYLESEVAEKPASKPKPKTVAKKPKNPASSKTKKEKTTAVKGSKA